MKDAANREAGKKMKLPVDDFLPEIAKLLVTHPTLIVSAETGAGKSTRLPPALLPLALGKKIYVLQPRRIAAISLAERVAEEQKSPLGKQVGYQVRFDSKVSASTQLIYLTEGIFEKILIGDPFLEKVGVVVLDEFHERSLHSDLILALLKDIQKNLNPELKVVVMSATLEAERLKSYLPRSAMVKVPGRTFPVELHFSEHPLNTGDPRQRNQVLVNEVANKIISVAPGARGDVLAFLPGLREIELCESALLENRNFAQQVKILKLHSSIPHAQQHEIFKASERKKIILSTNIAETSLTIEGVNTIVDSGLHRVMRFDMLRGSSRLDTEKISKANAAQRAGRAGRTQAGDCYRLWTRDEDLHLEAFLEPEVARVDLSQSLLMLAEYGIGDFKNFDWLQSPQPERLENTLLSLYRIGALDPKAASEGQQKITGLGKEILEFPLETRLAKFMVEAQAADLRAEAALVVAFFENQSLLKCDNLWEALESFVSRGTSPLFVKLAEQLSGTNLNLRATLSKCLQHQDALAKLLLRAYPEFLCRRKGQTFTMATGRGLYAEGLNALPEFFLGLEPFEFKKEGRVYLKIGLWLELKKEWIEESLPELIAESQDELLLNSADILQLKANRKFLELPLDEATLTFARARDYPAWLAQNFSKVIAGSESFREISFRYRFAQSHMPTLPPFDETNFIENFESLFSEPTKKINQSMDEICQQVFGVFLAQLPYALKSAYESQFPEFFALPAAGRNLKITYPEDPKDLPKIASKLQHFFGQARHPSIFGQKIPLKIELLSPAQRPVQVTSNLLEFWKTSYALVRKELRGRYPRHDWPEDPEQS